MRETTEGTSASVSTTTDRPAEPEGERSMGRAVLISSVAAAVVVFTTVTLGIGTAIDNYRAGAVLGAFCSAWVGPGFGAMVAGVLQALDHDRALAAAQDRR